MSKMCEICGKKPMVGSNISHAHNITKRRFNPNLQSVAQPFDFQHLFTCFNDSTTRIQMLRALDRQGKIAVHGLIVLGFRVGTQYVGAAFC
jgi:hypothetical protein